MTITIVAEVKHAGAEDNSASVTSASADTNPANNFAAAKTKLAPVLRLRKTASVKSASAGRNVGYTIVVSNPTMIAITRVTVCDRLPAGLAFVSSSPTASHNGGRVCWSRNKLGATASKTFRIIANAEPGFSGPKINRATATAPGVHSVGATATVRVSTPPLAPARPRRWPRPDVPDGRPTPPPTPRANGSPPNAAVRTWPLGLQLGARARR